MTRRWALQILTMLVVALAAPSARSQTTAPPAQCNDGAITAVGTSCSTADGGAGTCLAERCAIVPEDADADSLAVVVDCALCYEPDAGPPVLADGGAAIVPITTTSTTTTSDSGCSVMAAPPRGNVVTLVGFLVATALIVHRRCRRRW